MVALIFCGDLKYCPYLKRYMERLETLGADYTVYFWDRAGVLPDLSGKFKYFRLKSALNKSKAKKLLDFIKFRKWLIKNLNENRPDKIVALSTLTGVLLGKKLHNGNVPYVFDIRDYSYEHIKPFYKIEEKLIKNSVFTAISSDGFRFFLPKGNYVLAHNFNRSEITDNVAFTKHEGKLKFVWNGVIRYFDFQKQYLDALKNDERFEIVYHGDGPDLDLYKDYCRKNGIGNVVFTGTYDNSDKAKLLRDADILNNCYGCAKNSGDKTKYSVSNRFYDGMIYHIPQITECDSYKADWAKASGVGIGIPIDDDFADKLYEHYMGIDKDKFDSACDSTLKKVIEEDDLFIEQIDGFINS